MQHGRFHFVKLSPMQRFYGTEVRTLYEHGKVNSSPTRATGQSGPPPGGLEYSSERNEPKRTFPSKF